MTSDLADVWQGHAACVKANCCGAELRDMQAQEE